MQAKQRFAAIDLLRILAAAAVMAFHHLFYYRSYAAAFAPDIQTAASYGYLGVPLFFMISGYVITQAATGRTRGQFAFARFARLWPAFVICLGITVVARQLVGPALGGWVVLANLTMVPHLFGVPYIDDVYWSLMYEIFFYVAVTVLLVGSSNFVQRLRIFATVWLVLALVGLLVTLPELHTLLVLDFAPYFAVGIAIFLVRSESSTVVDRGLLAAALSLAFVFAAIRASVDSDVFANRVRPNIWLTGAIVLAGAGAIYASTIIETGPRLSRAALTLGGISYPLYLIHNSFGSVLIDLVPPGRLALSIFVAMTAVVAISYGIWRVEVPVRRHLMRAGRLTRPEVFVASHASIKELKEARSPGSSQTYGPKVGVAPSPN
jgi:peptidoglycan/LPS O-acetylase OafA/YrhL